MCYLVKFNQWVESKFKVTIRINKKLESGTYSLWASDDKDLQLHFEANDITNLEYLEGLDKLKEINKHA